MTKPNMVAKPESMLSEIVSFILVDSVFELLYSWTILQDENTVECSMISCTIAPYSAKEPYLIPSTAVLQLEAT